jgi:hypothetical protein
MNPYVVTGLFAETITLGVDDPTSTIVGVTASDN